MDGLYDGFMALTRSALDFYVKYAIPIMSFAVSVSVANYTMRDRVEPTPRDLVDYALESTAARANSIVSQLEQVGNELQQVRVELDSVASALLVVAGTSEHTPAVQLR